MASSRHSDFDTLNAALREATNDLDESGWKDAPRRRRDWKKMVLVLGLGALSWIATYIGMLELIQANMGELDIVTKVVIGCSVAMLMTMIIWLLDQLFAPLPVATKVSYFAGYVFLTMISVGFGFGFYWKVLESRSEASRSAESAVGQIQGSLTAAAARLDQLQGTLADLTTMSSAKAIEERESGTTCPNSRPGDGPRRKLRDADAAKFGFASSFVKGRAGLVKTDLKALDGSIAKIASNDPSIIDPKTNTRNAFMRGLERKLELTATRFNAFRTDPQLRQIRTDLAQRSDQTIFPTGRGNGTFSCPDPQLQTALRGVVRAIDQLPVLAKPTIATVEGSEAVIEAFRRLSATFYGALSFQLPPAADEMRELRKQAVRQAESNGRQPVVASGPQGGLTKRDYIPLSIALFVDLCLLLVSIGRPMNRMENLVPRMREAEQGPVYRILSKFSDIHRDPEIREKFEVFSHVVFNFNGNQYVAVPLDAPSRLNPDEYHRLRRDAHLLRNLFVSFEKERIVKPIVNPLLRRSAVSRILARQGSAFARAPAFQLYRFQDGAWADIILGAVMGASRRVEAQRRHDRLMNGPSLDTPVSRDQTITIASSADVPLQAEQHSQPQRQQTETVEEPARADAEDVPRYADGRYATLSAMPAHMATTASVHGVSDGANASAFGPYARSAARDFANQGQSDDTSALAVAAAHTVAPSTQTEPLAVRLRRQREARPVEAEIEIKAPTDPDPNVANNIVDFAEHRRSPMQSTAAVNPAETAPNVTQTTPAAARPSDNRDSDSDSAAMAAATPSFAPIVPPPLPRAPMAEQPAANATVTVRVTERTADITVPVSDANLPMSFLGARGDGPTNPVADAAFAEIEQSEEPQNKLEVAPIQPSEVLLIEADQGALGTAIADVETNNHADERRDFGTTQQDVGEPDPILARFAPARTHRPDTQK